jgi:hypothetical protein
MEIRQKGLVADSRSRTDRRTQTPCKTYFILNNTQGAINTEFLDAFITEAIPYRMSRA